MPIFFSDIAGLNDTLKDLTNPSGTVFILCDENTEKHCLPLLKSSLSKADIISISSGEKNKNLQTCEYIWNDSLTKIADRKSLLINLGRRSDM